MDESPLRAKETDLTKAPSTPVLAELAAFGSNPGNLGAWVYLPAIMAPKTPLVVVLHGCTQTAAGYDQGSGWSDLAERKGFAVLFAEQQRANNANLCFNWFEPGDTQRDRGEAESIRQMIEHVAISHGIDRKRVFVTGLSAGGAMANAMLAAYPELFSGGAIIGGLPYGVAANVGQAFERMQGRNAPARQELQTAISAASQHRGPWPRISVWHGTHDHTVKPLNAEHIIQQWSGAHHAGDEPSETMSINGHVRKVWRDETGAEVMESYTIQGMAHGVPLAAGTKKPIGETGPFMLQANISSTARIAHQWGLADADDVLGAEAGMSNAGQTYLKPEAIADVVSKALGYPRSKSAPSEKKALPTPSRVEKVITDALRAAGLMR